DPSRRDPAKAVALAQEAVAQAPQDAKCWNILGVARYRSGDFNGAILALQKHRELATGEPELSNSLFLAMAHWRLDHQDEARHWYHRGVESMDRNPKSSILIHARAEAAELLGESTTTADTLEEQNRQAWVLRRDNKLQEA